MDGRFVERLTRWDFRHVAWRDRASNIFRQVYLNPASGWEIAVRCARARVPFPEHVAGRDHWLFRAYMLRADSVRWWCPQVDEAHRLSQHTISGTLKAMLIAGLGEPVDVHLDLVARKLGIPRRTVEAFEILFFNVLDRHQDHLYVSQIVYPEGREVELAEDYFETVPIPDLLLRAAYNHRDIDLVGHLAGMGDASYLEDLGARRDREAELEKRFMGTGLVMSRVGHLNQRGVAMQRVSTLLAASRSARHKLHANVEIPDVPMCSAELAAAISEFVPMTEAEQRAAHAAMCPGRFYYSDETGEVFASDGIAESTISPEPTAQSQPPVQSEPMVRFPKPMPATWRNKDFDKPVILVARMSEPGLPDHYLTDQNTGIPVSEVFFEN